MGTSGSESAKGSVRRRGTPIVWAVAIALGAIAILSASIGWWIQDGSPRFPRTGNEVLDWLDLPVRGVQALLLSDIYYDGGLSEEAEPWLQLARITGALFSLIVAGRLLFQALGDSIRRRSLRARRNHVVIFGDGPATSDFVGLPGYGQVTQIAHGLEFSPGRFAHLPGDGTLADQAASSAAARSRRIMVNEETDERTWQTAMALARHVRDVDVVAILRGLEHNTSEARLRSISFAGGVARQVLLAHPPYLLAQAMQIPAQHILIVGFGAVAQAILREFLVTCPVLAPERMMVTVVANGVHDRAAAFMALNPDLKMVVDLCFIEGDIFAAENGLLEKLKQRRSEAEYCAVYLTSTEEAAVVGRADALRSLAIKCDIFRAPIFFLSDDGAGLSNVRHGSGLLGPATASDDDRAAISSRALMENRIAELSIVPFGTWRNALDGAGLLAPELDAHARMIHETYLAGVATPDTPTAPASPANRPWGELDGEYRVSNRRAALHIRAKAYSAGFDLNSWLDEVREGRMAHELPPAATHFAIGDPEFELKMSRLEHRRWMCERVLNGWIAGEQRNNFRKVHNMLRPYEELGDAEKQKDTAVIKVTRKILDASV